MNLLDLEDMIEGAFWHGYEDFTIGRDYNPYPITSLLYNHWQKGWLCAYHEYKDLYI
jgi:hypothetical protein